MISHRSPWKNSLTIRFIAAIDMAFASLLVFIYLQKLLSPISNEIVYNDTTTRVPSLKLFLLGPIIFNSFQIVMAFNLFSAARRRSEPLIAYAKANTWFQFSTAMLAFLILKLFLILWFPPHGSLSRRDIFGSTLIILETIFKIFSLFIVKEFIDDLRCILNTYPSPQFYCIYAPVPPSPALFPTTTGVSSNDYRNLPTIYPQYPILNAATQGSVAPPMPTTTTSQSNRNSAVATNV